MPRLLAAKQFVHIATEVGTVPLLDLIFNIFMLNSLFKICVTYSMTKGVLNRLDGINFIAVGIRISCLSESGSSVSI